MTVAIGVEPVPLKVDQDGVIRVGGTRVPLDTVVGVFNLGVTAEEIVLKYPALQLADVYSVIGYYLHHRAEVEAYLQAREQAAADVRRDIEARSDVAGIRERLLARRAQQSP